MAFTTIQGSGANDATSFVGTSGVDSIAIVNSTGNYILGAQGDADVVTVLTTGVTDPGVNANATLRGGQGNDTFTLGAAGAVILTTGVLINGNKDADTLTFTNAALTATTVYGGQGADTILTGQLVSSIANGNKDNDTITINGVSSSSSVYGGQGNDTINNTAAITSSLIGLSDGNDTFTAGAAPLTGSTVNGNAGNDTINAALATTNGVTLFGGEDNDSVTGSAQADTINSGTGNDYVVGGGAADQITFGTGNSTLAYTAAAQTGNGGVATGAAAGSYTVTTSDIITGAGVGDIATWLTTATAGGGYTSLNAAVATNQLAPTANFTNFADNQFSLIRGNYSVNNNVGSFTVSATGTSTLLALDTNAANGAQTYEVAVLSGVVLTGATVGIGSAGTGNAGAATLLFTA